MKKNIATNLDKKQKKDSEKKQLFVCFLYRCVL